MPTNAQRQQKLRQEAEHPFVQARAPLGNDNSATNHHNYNNARSGWCCRPRWRSHPRRGMILAVICTFLVWNGWTSWARTLSLLYDDNRASASLPIEPNNNTAFTTKHDNHKTIVLEETTTATPNASMALREQTDTSGTQFQTQPSHDDEKEPTPQQQKRGLVWLMSFPNSGTNFTMSMILRATNRSTATNYGSESQWKALVNVPALGASDDGIDAATSQNNGVVPTGPFLTKDSLWQHLELPDSWILTKTHCVWHDPDGRERESLKCSNGDLEPSSKEKSLVLPVEKFTESCASGHRLVSMSSSDSGNGPISTTASSLASPVDATKEVLYYSSSLVGKTTHLIRHPLENLVSRFHFDVKNKGSQLIAAVAAESEDKAKHNDTTSVETAAALLATSQNEILSKLNPNIFARYCAMVNADPKYSCWRHLLPTTTKARQALESSPGPFGNRSSHHDTERNSQFVARGDGDDDIGKADEAEPLCWPDLLKYVWWHNQAFAMTREQGMKSMVLYYEDFDRDFHGTQKALLDWLEQPLVAAHEGPEFVLQVYRMDHYTGAQRRAARRAIEAWASPDTWHYLQQRYYNSNEDEGVDERQSF
ncbi:hypothetical protein ACA910_015239 [Epithemia clementina (nom. ined.)]